MLVDKAFEMLGTSKAMDVAIYVLQHTNAKTKVFNRTYNQIQKDTGASQGTIARAFKYMESIGVLDYLGGSKWINNAVEGYSDNCNGNDFFVVNKGS